MRLSEGAPRFVGMSLYRAGGAELTVYLATEGKDGAIRGEASWYGRARVRARREHALHVVKRCRGFARVSYRGLRKNTARAFTLFSLANRYLVCRRLLQRGWVPCLT